MEKVNKNDLTLPLTQSRAHLRAFMRPGGWLIAAACGAGMLALSSAGFAQQPPAIELSELAGADGFAVHGIRDFGDAGAGVSAAGDVNGDGFDDVVIGSRFADEVYVVYGSDQPFAAALNLATLDSVNGFTLRFDGTTDDAVAGIGDINADGIDDIALGYIGADPDGRNNAGQVYVVFGQSGFPAAQSLASLANGSDGFVLNGIAAGDFAGDSVAPAGDINNDGIADFIIGASNAGGEGQGEAYAVFGRNSGFPSAVELDSLSGADGFAVRGRAASNALGQSTSMAGDVNGDGIDDLIVGAQAADPPGRANAGEAYVIFGSDGPFPALIDVGQLDGVSGFTVLGASAGDNAGRAVSAAGDINGDGIDDVAIGAPSADPGERSNAGEAYVVFGRATPFPAVIDLAILDGGDGFTLEGISAGDNLAGLGSLSAAGDINLDGTGDLLLGAPEVDVGIRFGAGQSYVLFGSNQAFPARIALSDLQGSNGFAINGMFQGDGSGDVVSHAGDVNADGNSDLVIGARNAGGAAIQAGEAYVVFGGRLPLPHLVLQPTQHAGAAPIEGLLSTGIDALQIEPFGFTQGDNRVLSITGETGTFSPYNQDDGVGIEFYELPPDTLLFSAQIVASQAPDPDLFLGRDDNGDGEIEVSEERCSSGTSGFMESCRIDAPEAGSWWVAVINWAASSPTATDDTDLSVLALQPSDGSLSAAGPAGAVPAGTHYELELLWNLDPADPPGSYFGALRLGSGAQNPGDLGVLTVRIDVDIDNDGIPDGDDNCPSVQNEDQADNEGDGLGDVCDDDDDNDSVDDSEDNCPFDANPDQADGDQNGIGDACDDRDGDGVNDAADNCPATSNPDQADADGDGDGDACDADDDNDSVPDDIDNCPFASNPDQADPDADGYGSACDNCPLAANADQADADADSLGDACDNCVLQANVQQRDADEDGIGTACDPDHDQNCAVNFLDLVLFKQNFAGANPEFDYDGNGFVNFSDLIRMKALFFQQPGPSGIPNVCD